MLLLNFSHPITVEQVQQIEMMSKQKVDQVIERTVQFDNQKPYLAQLKELLNSVPLTPTDWQTLPLIINLPALNIIAAMLLAELHGRMGYFPTIIRLRAVEGGIPLRYEVAELINLQEVRDKARQLRGKLRGNETHYRIIASTYLILLSFVNPKNSSFG
jgi:hypothetical protein